MPVNVSRLRRWFAVAAVAIVVIVAGFYIYARMRFQRVVREAPNKLGIEIQQSTQGFSLSKSEGGHTLFTVRAASATQYKQGGRAELQDVNIVIYGHEANRFDQIYGKTFEYDPQSGNVIAEGVVHIDLQSDTAAASHPDQAPPPELKNPIHVMTSGLVFNQKSGDARTDQRVEFRIPQANGYADGAIYDSKHNELVLDRNVHIETGEPDPANIVARHGVLTKEPRRAVLYSAKLERQSSTVDASLMTVFLREDNSIDHILASGGVQSSTRGATMLNVRAPEAVLYMKGKSNDLNLANLRGGTTFETSGASTMSGSSDSVTLNFAGHNLLSKVRAEGHVRLIEPPKQGSGKNAQTVELASDIIDFWLTKGRNLQRAETTDQAQITLTPVPSATASPAASGAASSDRTVITAAKCYAAFDGQNRLKSLTGVPDAKVVSYTTGQSERVTTSRLIEVGFAPTGGASSVVQRDNFQYHEKLPSGGDRAAWAEWASYSPQTEVLTLNGKPRVVEGGMTTTARVLRFDRRTGDATAEGDVKTTYSELTPQPNGALLASGDPIHVTARSMTAQRSTSIAHYSGDARLWQGTNIIEAATIDFDRNNRTVLAKALPPPSTQSAKPKLVTTVLVQQDKTGKQSPVTVTSKSLEYVDGQRIAHFEGGVTIRGNDGTTTANKVDVFLKPREAPPTVKPAKASATPAPSQVDHIIAEGRVHVQQPSREAQGEKLVYTAAEGKFVMTGGAPSITDAEHGTIRGASLTFYTRDDRVLVEGGDSSRTVTTTRVSK